MSDFVKSSVELEDIPCHGPDAVKRILYIDAHDSFTRNVTDLLEDTLKVIVDVICIDDSLAEDLQAIANRYDAIVAGPGPGNPNNAADIGHMKELWNLRNVPVLGVCLGFQSLCCEYGAEISRLSQPQHGRVVEFAHADTDIFRGLSGFKVTLYNSLRVRLSHPLEKSDIRMGDSRVCWEASKQCEVLLPLAWHMDEESIDGAVLMAVRHRSKPFWGLQFHPESCKSDDEAKGIVRNWWEDVGQYNRVYRESIERQKLQKLIPADFAGKVEDHGVDLLLRLTQSEDKRVCYRVCPQDRQTTAAEIGEIVGLPYSPGVVLEVGSRYSIISVPGPGSWTLECILGDNTLRAAFSWHKKSFEQRIRGGMETFHECIRRVLNARRAEGGDPEVPFWGGFLGYLSYEMGVQQFGIPASKYIDGEEASDAHLIWVDRSIVIDREKGKIYVQSLRGSDDETGGWLDLMVKRLKQSVSSEPNGDAILEETIAPGDGRITNSGDSLSHHLQTDLFDKTMKNAKITPPGEWAYKKNIETCQEYICRGDSYELCLTGETKVRLPKCQDEQEAKLRSWLMYKRLQNYNPAAYSGYARIGRARVISSSPELFMRWDRQATFEMKPMKGTVKKTPDMTLEKATEILDTPKEMGENLMIADLIRHDLFSQCGSGNVEVVSAMTVEDHTLVYQLTTHVKGYSRFLPPVLLQRGVEKPKMRSGNDHHALARCMPPGSMTGAPKKRSCQILDRVEERKRGIYSGAMGFFDVGGGGSFSVIIRSAFSLSDGVNGEETWRIGAGGAITALSTAQGEWDEMMTKLNTVLAIFRPAGDSGEGQSGNASSKSSRASFDTCTDKSESDGASDKSGKSGDGEHHDG